MGMLVLFIKPIMDIVQVPADIKRNLYRSCYNLLCGWTKSSPTQRKFFSSYFRKNVHFSLYEKFIDDIMLQSVVSRKQTV